MSRDSAIYYLKTFEVDPTLFLQLPAYQVTPGDCTVFQSGADSLRIIQMVGEVPDSISIEKLPLKMNVAYHPVGYELNYFILSLVGAGLILVAAVVWIFFGRKISRFFKTRSLTARHRKFIESFERTVNELQGKFSPVATESAVSLWKKYLETLESRPYTKMTSRETVRFLNDKKLAEKFYFIDRAIYGGEGMVIEPLQHLKVVADERFTKKIDELKHAK